MQLEVDFFDNSESDIEKALQRDQHVKFILFGISGVERHWVVLLFRGGNHNNIAKTYRDRNSIDLAIQGAGNINVQLDNQPVTNWGSGTFRQEGLPDIPSDDEVRYRLLECIKGIAHHMKIRSTEILNEEKLPALMHP